MHHIKIAFDLSFMPCKPRYLSQGSVVQHVLIVHCTRLKEGIVCLGVALPC